MLPAFSAATLAFFCLDDFPLLGAEEAESDELPELESESEDELLSLKSASSSLR